MICPSCGKDIKAANNQRFCIYCGQPLTNGQKAQTSTPNTSGVMRIHRKADFSQSALPAIQQDNSKQKMTLASLSGTNAAIKPAAEDTDMSKNKQSLELKNLLDSLDGSKRSTKSAAANIRDNDEVSSCFNDEDGADVDLSSSYDSMELDPSGSMPRGRSIVSRQNGSTQSLVRESSRFAANVEDDDEEDLLSDERDDSVDFTDNGFFLGDEEDDNTSGPIPTASGTFTRDSSGGFKLALETIKTAFSKAVDKARDAISNITKGSSATKTSRRAKNQMATQSLELKKEKRTKAIALLVVVVAICALIVLVVARGSRPATQVENAVATNDTNNFELIEIPADDSLDGEIPAFDPAAAGFASNDFDFAEDEADPEAPVIQAAAAKATAKAEAPSVKSNLKEKRQYGRNDNLMASASKGENFKVKRACVMREGPASRFPFVTEVKSGTTIEILTKTDEDWLFQNGVWTKNGQANRLGPGTQFAAADKGMTVAAPQGRVISAKNWRYVKAGNKYGYVGPACFK